MMIRKTSVTDGPIITKGAIGNQTAIKAGLLGSIQNIVIIDP
jgi:hypothetical protein